MAEVTYISYSARAKSTTADGIFAEAHQILDVSKNKNQQAINAEVTTELGKKVAKSDFDSFKTSNTSAIAAKADKSYVDTELKKKLYIADFTESSERMEAEIEKKADKIYVDAELKKKADQTTVENLTLQLGQKVDVTAFNEHKTSSSLLISSKANSADVYTKTQVYTKSETDTKLGTKANSADVYTKAQADSAITAKVNAAVASVYRVKGTKATIAEVTALTNVKCGDVWNVTAEFTLGGKKYPAGTNVVALADKSTADAANWDALGGTVDLAGHTQEMKTWANGQFAGKAYEAKVTTNTSNISSLTTRVGAVETKATTNASNISSLTTRVTAAEGKFAGYYTKGEVDGKVGAAKMQKILITDLDKETLDKLKSDASRACMQVVDSNSRVVGVVFQYSDNSNHVLTQEFHTHYTFGGDGTFDGTTGMLNAHNHHSVAVLSRMFVGSEDYDFANSMSVYCNDFGWLSPAGNAIQDYFKLFKYNVSAMPTGQNFPHQKWTPWRNIEAEDAYFINQRMEKLEKLLTLA